MIKLFGTDGIRGRAGEHPLDAATLPALGWAVGRVLTRDVHHAARIVVGRDTRESGREILDHLAAGLRAAGAIVHSAGVLPTPGVSYLARTDEFDAGVVISASHNPHPDNGIKLFSHAGTKLSDELESEIERELDDFPGAPPPGSPPDDETPLRDAYAAWLVERGRAVGCELSGLTACVDCAHGAASALAPTVLRALGAGVHPIHDAPNGSNINENCGSLHPEGLAGAVRDAEADVGIAFDGDADRVLFVDAGGRVLDGDHVLLIASDALRAEGTLRGGAVVGTVMSNYGLERALQDRGVRLLRSAVGDRYVYERMVEEGCNLGGEQSGHVIFSDEAPTGDGILTALHVLAAIRRSGRPLAELADGLPRVPQLLRNVPVRDRLPLENVSGYPDLVHAWNDRLDGTGRLLVRYSGTELLVRVMAEGTDAQLVEACVEEVSSLLASELRPS